MAKDRLFIDTAFIQALLNRKDEYHEQAKAALPRVTAAAEVWVTEAVLVELANALSALDRQAAARFVDQCYRTPNIRVVTVDTPLLMKGLHLYRTHQDKKRGLTDCISMVAMREHDLFEVVTADHHFKQAGFRATFLA